MRGNGTYGIKRPSLISPNMDVEIWYHYRPERNSTDTSFENFKLYDEPGSILSNATVDGANAMVSTDNRLPGMYNLMLPVGIFGKSGYYTIYIKPKDIQCEIKDVGVLSAYNDIRGIVIDTETVPPDVKNIFTSPDALVGYRVEYFDYEGVAGGLTRQNYYRIVTSNNLCDAVSQTNTSANAPSNGYRFNESGTLCFLTVTPSISPTFKATTLPYIGTPNQKIAITNTKFDPVMIEVNVTEHDIETLATMLEGDQIRSLDRGLVTTYNKNGEIYIQQSFFTLKDSYNGTEMMEVRKKNQTIDNTPNYEDIINQ